METGKKFKLTDEFIIIYNKKLYRIEALKDFSDVKRGDKGGFVESEENLSQNGNCWIYDDAKVYGYAKVFGNAQVYNNANIYNNAKVYGDARIGGNAEVYYNAKVYNNAMVEGNAEVFGDAWIYNNARVYGNAKIFVNARIFGNSVVFGNAQVYGFAEISGNAKVLSCSDYIVFKNWWSSGRYFTWTRSNNMWKVGCFHGTGEELIAKVYKDSELSGKEYERVVKYVETILRESNTTKILNKIKQCLTKFIEKFKL